MAQMGLLKGCLGRHKGCISYRVVWENPPRWLLLGALLLPGGGCSRSLYCLLRTRIIVGLFHPAYHIERSKQEQCSVLVSVYCGAAILWF